MNNFSFSDLSMIDLSVMCENTDEVIDVNKENFDSSIQTAKLKTSRKSLLKTLDPLNPYSSPQQKTEILQSSNESNNLDQSWNFLKFDNTSEDNDILPQTNRKSDLLFDFEHFENDNNQSINSQLLDLSSETNGVPTDDLLNISPMRNFVDKSIHNKLKKYHIKKQEEWKASEKDLLVEIDHLRQEILNQKNDEILKEKQMEINQLLHDHEIKVLVLSAEKQALIDKLVTEKEEKIKELNEEKELIINELLQENEENLEKLKKNHSAILISKQTELDNVTKENQILRQEIDALNSSKIFDRIVVDQYYETIEEMIKQHEDATANINQDNREMELMLNKYLTKINSSKSVINAQLKNEDILKEQLKNCQEKIEFMELELSRKSLEFDKTNENFNHKIANMKAEFDRSMNRKEIKIHMLENAEINLKAELELRIRERDQFKENLKELLE